MKLVTKIFAISAVIVFTSGCSSQSEDTKTKGKSISVDTQELGHKSYHDKTSAPLSIAMDEPHKLVVNEPASYSLSVTSAITGLLSIEMNSKDAIELSSLPNLIQIGAGENRKLNFEVKALESGRFVISSVITIEEGNGVLHQKPYGIALETQGYQRPVPTLKSSVESEGERIKVLPSVESVN